MASGATPRRRRYSLVCSRPGPGRQTSISIPKKEKPRLTEGNCPMAGLSLLCQRVQGLAPSTPHAHGVTHT